MIPIEQWINKVNSNQRLVASGRWLNLNFTFGYGDEDYLFKIKDGQLITIYKRIILTESGVFRIHAEKNCWEKHWLETPPRDYHDIFAMLAKKIVTIDGNLIPLIQNLQYFKDIIASNRNTKTQLGLK